MSQLRSSMDYYSTDVALRLYAAPTKETSDGFSAALIYFRWMLKKRLRELDAMCGRFATETGAFWARVRLAANR